MCPTVICQQFITGGKSTMKANQLHIMEIMLKCTDDERKLSKWN
jgi:hypothetical protein